MCICQGTQHAFNLIVSAKIGGKNGLECEWYIVNLICDSIFGVLFQYFILEIVLRLTKDTDYHFETGNYYKNHIFCYKEYFYQMIIWFIIVVVSKFINVGIVLIFSGYFEAMGYFILKGFKGKPKLKLAFVMIIFPLIFNTLQFWVTDSFIQRHTDEEVITNKYSIKDESMIKDNDNNIDEKENSNKESKNNKENININDEIKITNQNQIDNEETSKLVV